MNVNQQSTLLIRKKYRYRVQIKCSSLACIEIVS